ncbi:hypothetical protein V2H29_17265 [Lysinibacillus fusiformis]|uniref:Uncharacterized protein n=1 Tax=Lysinibacillus fusiformis TaxID=28031 RepID=A0A2I0UYD8_9BACI|nr:MULTISPECIES: hypothetical protein [Lysinibacillus]MEE3808688.1 hypothetical protein [Lysinibacillus fusiformis]PKU51084.1 hypothetical protein CRI88_15520 [Lysinibacillus fusiformis]WCH49348.1 hypothetical protein NV349_08205 [Lysinibacillus sp. OF-1]
MFEKAFGSLFLASIFCFSIVPTSFASTSSSDCKVDGMKIESEDTMTSKIPISLEMQTQLQSSEGVSSVIITDKSVLEEIAVEQGLEEVPVRIEYEYTPSETDFSKPDQEVTPYAKGEICYVKDLGSGWYNENYPYKTFFIDGPDTFKISEKKSFKSTFDGTFGASKAGLEAKIGFKLEQDFTVEFTSNTPIKADESIYFELFTTHHKVQYAVDTGSTCNFGHAYKPDGTFIKKTVYKK